MGNSLGRGGRRRRVLNEEMVAASGTHSAYRKTNEDQLPIRPATYGEAAASENHCRVSDFAPQRSGTLWLVGFLGMGCVAGFAALDFFAPGLAAQFGFANNIDSFSAFSMSAAGSLASWFASVVLLVASACCLLVYSLRQHKLADYRGRYRAWLWAAMIGIFLSICSVTNLHGVLSTIAAHFSGWSALPEHAVWWLASGGIICGWFGYRLLRDAWESRLARTGFLLSYSLLVVSFLTQFQVLPVPTELDAQVANLIAPTALLASEVCLLIAIAAYARFVILDADGLLGAKAVEKQSAEPKAETTTKTTAAKSKPQAASSSKQTATAPSRTKTASNKSYKSRASNSTSSARTIEWTDGSTPDANYDDERPAKRKLSKSERKALRKKKAQQQQRRAA